MYLTYYNLLIAQGLYKANYQIFSIIFLKKFTKWNVNLDTMMKNVKLVDLDMKWETVF